MPKVPGWCRYMEDVITGKRLAGRLERLSVERCVRLVQKDNIYFDEAEANRVIEIVSLFRHTKGKYAGEPFQIMEWQSFFLAMLFGLRYVDSNLRLFRKALLCVPKKNGKSEFAGAIGNLFNFFDDEEGAECYSAANKYDQALFSWVAAKSMIRRAARESEWLNQVLKIYDSTVNRSLVNCETDSFFKPIAADAKTLDGVNPHLAIIDEYHEAKDSGIPDNMESGMVSREQPLLLIITTRGFNIKGPLWQLEQSMIHILEGTAENDSVFPMIYSLDEEDDWEDETLWEKANPGLGRTPTVEGLRQEFVKAQTEGAQKEISFKTKNLNVWTSVSERWVKDSDFIAGATEWEETELEGAMCFAGFDLAKTRDITAISYFFPPQKHWDNYRVLTRYFLPEDTATESAKSDRVPYIDWARANRITFTPGNVRDDSHIISTIQNDSRTFNIAGISYDPWNATSLAVKLSDEEIKVNEFRQTTSNFNEPITNLERIILQHDLDCGGDPVMRWMFGNIQTYVDGNGNIKFDKGRSRSKIDGPVALAMAVAEWLNYKESEPASWDDIIWR